MSKRNPASVVTGPFVMTIAVMVAITVGAFYLTAPEMVPFTDAYEVRQEQKRIAADAAEKERRLKEARKAKMDAWQNRLAGAHVSCKDAVRQRSKHPSAATFDRDVADVMRQFNYPPDAQRVVLTGRVNMMNGFGNLIPHRYACSIDVPNWRLTDVSVTPG